MSLDFLKFNALDMRATARVNIFSGFFITGGADDIFNKTAFSSFIGAGLFLTNDDLKTLLTRIPGM